MSDSAPGQLLISNKDLVSFTFDNPSYDVDRPVFIDPNDPSKHFSHRTAKSLVRRLISGLKAEGLQPGDTVCIHSFNSIIFPILALAVIGAGGLCTGTNPSYTENELNHAIKLAQVRYVLAEPNILSNLLGPMQKNGLNPRDKLFVLDSQPDHQVPSDLKSWKSLLEHGEQDWIRFDDEKSSHRVCQLFLTSGTTGLPKCTATSHRNLVAQHQLYCEPNRRPFVYREVYCLPFFHAGIWPRAVISALREGWEVYVMKKFDVEPFLRFHGKYNITEIFVVPPMIVSILNSGLADPKSKTYTPDCSLRGVRNGTTGAAPCSADIQRRFCKLLGEDAAFTQVWGMTEATCVVTTVPWDVARKTTRGEMDTWGTVGKPLPNLQVKLVDTEGNDVTHLGRGEICVRGPTVVKGYFGNEQATRESWDKEGFYKTGDLIRVDEHGLMYVEGRSKELIKVRGFQVAPAELEAELTAHPEIDDAAVIGVTFENDNELPRAYIVPRPGSNLTEAQVHDYMKDRLARFKQLAGGIRFVTAIPKLASGKILKRVLKEDAKRELANEVRSKL
ncbi:putative AMP-binding enzyme [Mariannaea sp. PMI_226]|nr:putative AMP-binding enzyme [Mariannaea sp. PMI_226]